MKMPPILTDELVLRVMRARPHGIMTYVVRNILELEHGFQRLSTARVRVHLRRLELEGDVVLVPSSYATQLCWAFTEAGRRRAEAE